MTALAQRFLDADPVAPAAAKPASAAALARLAADDREAYAAAVALAWDDVAFTLQRDDGREVVGVQSDEVELGMPRRSYQKWADFLRTTFESTAAQLRLPADERIDVGAVVYALSDDARAVPVRVAAAEVAHDGTVTVRTDSAGWRLVHGTAGPRSRLRVAEAVNPLHSCGVYASADDAYARAAAYLAREIEQEEAVQAARRRTLAAVESRREALRAG